MLAKTYAAVREAPWAIAHVRSNARLPFRTLEDAREEFRRSEERRPIAAALAAEVWDRFALRLVRKASDEESLRDAWRECRQDSAAYELCKRKLNRILLTEALAADSIEATVEAERCMRNTARSPRLVRKVRKFLSDFRATAETIEDYQRIFYYSDWNLELREWAEDNWDRLSKAEVDKARTLGAAKKAHERAHLVRAHGICSSCGWRRKDAEEYAAAKWDRLALAKMRKARTKRQIRFVLDVSRVRSQAKAEAFAKALELETDFESVESLAWSNNSLYTPFKQQIQSKLLDLCKTVEQAVEMYDGQLNPEIAKELLKRFPELGMHCTR